ncbi:XkdQ/YqbQ family protein [Paenibacillus sp. FSL L8-0708]|uniref:XkdQ/YqbQ family protein n=1 Tax=Paenibacillus sp. FSL L8-0708 TaxID=2975311 RepID=UPI0030F5B798
MELLIDNKNGTVWDVSSIVTDISWKTIRIGKAASLEFTLVDHGPWQDKKFQLNNGDVVRYTDEGHKVFYGYIFSIETGKTEEISILAYDQIRYLMNSGTYVFTKQTATQVVQKIAQDMQLKTGTLEDTKYIIPSQIRDDKTFIDMICMALDETLINYGTNFVFFDDFGSLTIRNASNMRFPFVVGDDSLMTDYSYSRNIDDETYNQIVMYRDNKETGKRETYVTKDSASIAKWGLLQLYESVDENLNQAQITEQLTQQLFMKNREKRTLSIEALGDYRMRAGCYVNLYINAMNINKFFLVDECTHKKEGGVHTMDLELRLV